MGSREGYKLIARSETMGADTTVRTVTVASTTFGAGRPTVIAGPCAVESLEQTLSVARAVQQCGADMLRGGVFKPRTSPYDFQGLGEQGLLILEAVREKTGLPIVTEVMDTRLVERIGRSVDMLQIGSRNMQNYPLLAEVGRFGKPVLLKRGVAATLYEWLCAAEYIAREGNENIVLCERGIRTFAAGEYSRFSLDLNVLSAVRRETDLPVIVDPSHATGDPNMVPLAAGAAVEAGADGLIIEVISGQTARQAVLCDGDQAIRPDDLQYIVGRINSRRVALPRVAGGSG